MANETNKLKLFIDNLLVYGLGGVISKLIPFIMVPIVSWLLPTTEYMGISDMSNTAVQFASAIAVMGMYDAMYRLFFEKKDELFQKRVCSTAIVFTFLTSTLVFLLMLIFRDFISQIVFKDRQLSYVVYISAIAALVGATNSIVSAPTRMQNKRKVFLVTNTVSPILSYSISIPLILSGHYVIALPLAAVISGISMEIAFGVINRKWFNAKLFDKKLLKQLLVIAIPLLPNFLIYWVFNSCDKLMITNILGLGAAGVYSVGSKLGHASQLIYTAFAGGWQFFAFSTMKEKKQVESNSKIFEYLGVISFVATCFVCALCFLIFKLIFKPEYLDGYIISPYLFLAPLLQMLFQVAANQFLVVKKTWPNFFILFSGAIINLILNFFLIPVMGIEGASIATLVGYVISDIICVIVLCRMKLMIVSRKFIVSVVVFSGFFVSWRFLFSNNTLVGLLISVFVSAVLIMLYRSELKLLLTKFKSRKASSNETKKVNE